MTQDIDVDMIDPTPWNTNKMSEKAFNRLVEEIATVGFHDPLTVVPWLGRFRVLGGEHRWRAVRTLGHKAVECKVLDDPKFQDEKLQELLTIRYNVLHGDQDPEKFSESFDRMAEIYGENELQRLFGFTDEDAYNRLVKETRDSMKAGGMPQEMIDAFEKAAKEKKGIDQLATILGDIMGKYGNTLAFNFMAFAHGDREVLYIAAEDKVYKQVKDLVAKSLELQMDVNVPLRELLSGWKALKSLKPKEEPGGKPQEKEEAPKDPAKEGEGTPTASVSESASVGTDTERS